MKKSKFCFLFVVLVFLGILIVELKAENLADQKIRKPLNIAHRGACGYLPEHTLQAKAMAYAMDIDFLEQDVVLTKDIIPVVLHDIHLDTVTDVAVVYPQRARKDGRYYVADFTLAEIRKLKVNERINLKTGKRVFPQRFPGKKSLFRISTLVEEIEMIQGLNDATGKNIGIYTEIKSPAWHRKEGLNISEVVLETLADYGYKDAKDNCYLQCFEADELKRIKNELNCKLKLIQLLEDDCNLKEVAEYACGIGPWIGQIITDVDKNNQPVISDLVKRAHAVGLKVHPYTFRIDSGFYSINSTTLLKILFKKVKINGIFSDFPDVSGKFLKAHLNE